MKLGQFLFHYNVFAVDMTLTSILMLQSDSIYKMSENPLQCLASYYYYFLNTIK